MYLAAARPASYCHGRLLGETMGLRWRSHVPARLSLAALMAADHLRWPACAEAVSVPTIQAPAHLSARASVPNATSNRGNGNTAHMWMANGMLSNAELPTQQNYIMQRPATTTIPELHHFACGSYQCRNTGNQQATTSAFRTRRGT